MQAGGLCALGGWTAPRVPRRAPSAGIGLPCLSFRRLPFRRSASGLALSTLHPLSAAWRPLPVSSRTFSRVLFAECLSVPGKGPECSSGSILPVGLHLLAPAEGRTRAPDSFSSCLHSCPFPRWLSPLVPQKVCQLGVWILGPFVCLRTATGGDRQRCLFRIMRLIWLPALARLIRRAILGLGIFG